MQKKKFLIGLIAKKKKLDWVIAQPSLNVASLLSNEDIYNSNPLFHNYRIIKNKRMKQHWEWVIWGRMGLVCYIFINKIKSYCFDVQGTLKTRCRLVSIACTGGILLFFLSFFFFF